jgi:hypothetical protein
MARSTGPVLAIGAITILNRTVFNDQPMDWRIPIATGIAAGLLALAENVIGNGAVYIAYLALAAVVLSRVDPTVPSPAESALKWFNAR